MRRLVKVIGWLLFAYGILGMIVSLTIADRPMYGYLAAVQLAVIGWGLAHLDSRRTRMIIGWTLVVCYLAYAVWRLTMLFILYDHDLLFYDIAFIVGSLLIAGLGWWMSHQKERQNIKEEA